VRSPRQTHHYPSCRCDNVRRILACAASGATAALLAVVANRKATQAAIGHASRWVRPNYSGVSVTLAEGPIAVVALLAGGAVDGLIDRNGRRSLPVAVAGVGAGLMGAYDDLYGATHAKGFRGHLRALRSGELTSGMIKIIGIGGSAAVAATLLQRSNAPRPARPVLGGLLDTGLIAATANLVNLLDLRPGRAAKAVIVLGSGLVGFGAAPAVGAAAGSLPTDLAGRSMLGDCGANALGAAVATAAAQALPWQFRLLAFGAVAALNLASEQLSFTAVIERTPLLRRLDQLGRRDLVASSMSTNDHT
jgi:UDP-GlcNAc:undecaprenyl-phosphate/decaprenyl-phosphate GlcNAc-1-phosphate transferase